MAKPEKPKPVTRIVSVPISPELETYIRSVADELEITEDEAVQELLFLIMYWRRLVMAGAPSRQVQPQAPETIAAQVPAQAVRINKFDRLGVITAIAFGVGALLAVLYVLLTKR